MAEILTTIITLQILGNEIWRIVFFIIALLLTIPVRKVVIYITDHYFIKWASKTDFKFDDILIKSINPSISLFVFAGLFYLGSESLNQGNYAEIFSKLLNFLIIIPVVYFMIKFSTEVIGYYLKGDKKSKRINEAAIDLLMQVVRIILFLIGILLILGNLGYDVSALLAGLGVGGLAFALAAQDILKNFFSGVALVFDKTFNKGERVKFQENEGIIEELKLRSTKLRTFDGTLMTIPNAMLADNIVENVTKTPKVKVTMTLTLTYDTSVKKLKKAKQIVEDILNKEEHTKNETRFIWFDNFNSFSLDIIVVYFQDLDMNDWPERIYVKERVNFAIKEQFEKEGLEFAFPTQTIEMKK
jgi:MscS family membrane protein